MDPPVGGEATEMGDEMINNMPPGVVHQDRLIPIFEERQATLPRDYEWGVGAWEEQLDNFRQATGPVTRSMRYN